MEKSCTKCNVVKPLTDFNKKKVAPDGVRSECRACQKSYFKTFADENQEYMRKRDYDRYHADAAGERKRSAEWAARTGYKATRREKYQENPIPHRQRSTEWRAANLDKSKASVIAWQRNNRPYFNRRQQEREATKLKATPEWMDPRYVQMFYDMAAEATELTGVKHHVDHIVPLRSALVCGLHCEHNLQVLPAADNIRKSNRVWPDMP